MKNLVDHIHELIEHRRVLAIVSSRLFPDRPTYQELLKELTHERKALNDIYIAYIRDIKNLRDHTHVWNDEPTSDHSCIVCGAPFGGPCSK